LLLRGGGGDGASCYLVSRALTPRSSKAYIADIGGGSAESTERRTRVGDESKTAKEELYIFDNLRTDVYENGEHRGLC